LYAPPKRPPREFRKTTPQQLASLTLYRPAMPEAVLGSASAADAEVWRGATVRDLRRSDSRLISVERNVRLRTPGTLVCNIGNCIAKGPAKFPSDSIISASGPTMVFSGAAQHANKAAGAGYFAHPSRESQTAGTRWRSAQDSNWRCRLK
jgi:hypothetical protein